MGVSGCIQGKNLALAETVEFLRNGAGPFLGEHGLTLVRSAVDPSEILPAELGILVHVAVMRIGSAYVLKIWDYLSHLIAVKMIWKDECCDLKINDV